MFFGEPSHRGDAIVPHERPFEGAYSSSVETDGDGFGLVLRLYPKLREWVPVLRLLPLSPDAVADLAQCASRNGTDFLAELLASGLTSEDEVARAMATHLGTGTADDIVADRLVIQENAAIALLQRMDWKRPVMLAGTDGLVNYLTPLEGADLGRLRARANASAEVRRRLKPVSGARLRAALLNRFRTRLVQRASNGLFETNPGLSARLVLNTWQGVALGALLVALPVVLFLTPGRAWLSIHVMFSFFFMSCVGLRFAALLALDRSAGAPPASWSPDMPVYSVLVALYREAGMASELVRALDRIEWPRSRLEIKLVCEEDDRETISALQRLSLPSHMEIIEVPAGGPRTKPKALAYALMLSGGEFVALYDAEDHPHPRQLLHAWQTFCESGMDVACVQAPLEIANRSSGLLARMFAFEYAALFRGMLPWLSGKRLPVPLGGTSNHFRRSAIEGVGGWDPYNVTEDADLGMRLARFGYRTRMTRCPTWETAPETLAAWLPQRTRWFKGWIQTWLVHMRSPIRLFRDLGFWPFFVGQILFAGMVLSALAHPFLLVTGLALSIDLLLAGSLGGWKSTLLAMDFISVAGGYLSFLLLGWQVLKFREKLAFWKVVLFTPLYWMLLSWAAWRAIWQLWRAPFLWEKTPHRPLGGDAGQAGMS